MRRYTLVIATLAVGALIAGCGAGASTAAPTTTSTTAAPTATSAVVYGSAFQLAAAIHGHCTATHNDAAKTGTVNCGIDIANQVELAVKVPAGAWTAYTLSYSGTPISSTQKQVRAGYLYLDFVGAVNDTIKTVTFSA